MQGTPPDCWINSEIANIIRVNSSDADLEEANEADYQCEEEVVGDYEEDEVMIQMKKYLIVATKLIEISNGRQ